MSRGNPIFRLRLEPDVRARWQAAATAAGVSLSEWVRDVVESAQKDDQRCATCINQLGANYFGDVPDVGSICAACHDERFPMKP